MGRQYLFSYSSQLQVTTSTFDVITHGCKLFRVDRPHSNTDLSDLGKDCQFGVSPVNYSDPDSGESWVQPYLIASYDHLICLSVLISYDRPGVCLCYT